MSHWKIGVKIVAKAGRVKILWKLKYGGQNSIFFSWNPWSKFYVPWKGGSKFYLFSQCLEKGGSKPRSLPTNFTEGVPPPGFTTPFSKCLARALRLLRILYMQKPYGSMVNWPLSYFKLVTLKSTYCLWNFPTAKILKIVGLKFSGFYIKMSINLSECLKIVRHVWKNTVFF